MYFSYIRVKWSNPRNGVAPFPHLGVVSIEKGAFGSSSTEVANFTYIHDKGTNSYEKRYIKR